MCVCASRSVFFFFFVFALFFQEIVGQTSVRENAATGYNWALSAS